MCLLISSLVPLHSGCETHASHLSDASDGLKTWDTDRPTDMAFLGDYHYDVGVGDTVNLNDDGEIMMMMKLC